MSHFQSDLRGFTEFGSGRGLDGLAEMSLDPVGDETTVGLDAERAVFDHEIGCSVEPHVPTTRSDATSDLSADPVRDAVRQGLGS